MPNHVQHYVSFVGSAADIACLLNHIRNAESDTLFDFNNVIPMPAELEHTTSPSEPNEVLITKYGYSDWYGWKVNNWGTKWGAYETHLSDDGKLCFQTAWSTPEVIFAKLSEMFPTVEMTVDYADEDMGQNVGQYTYKGGELTNKFVGDLEEACRIWGYDYDDYIA